ncbi:hypothetical protein Tco_1125067 [Tanacetum coccineum]|uniref:Uncharacterized protein n=1 Tax=Tanacetum coccineum TaxID=301880 RepID=A0ABQ5J7Y1_9ASTR
MHMLTKPQAFYDECHKTTLGYQNPLYLTQAQRKVLVLYYGNTIVKQHDALSVIDTDEILELAEESRIKMHTKQNDPIMQEKKVNIAPIDYVALNKLSEHFVKYFVPQKQLSTEQAFWLPISKPVSETPSVQPEPVLKEIPRELPTISLVKDSFNKMRNHVNDFENVVTIRTKEHADTLHEIVEHARALRPLDSDLDSAYMTVLVGSALSSSTFVSKFMGTVRIRNDHVAAIRGYGDYQIGNVCEEIFLAVKGWLDEDLEYYHLKELHYSAQCHTQMSLWTISRGVVLLILLMEYKYTETAPLFLLTSSKLEGDDVMIFCNDVTVADLKESHGRYDRVVVRPKTFSVARGITSWCNVKLNSAHGGCKLNEDADDLDAEEEEVQEFKPMGRGKAKKKASSSSAPSEYSIFPPLVDQLVDK